MKPHNIPNIKYPLNINNISTLGVNNIYLLKYFFNEPHNIKHPLGSNNIFPLWVNNIKHIILL